VPAGLFAFDAWRPARGAFRYSIASGDPTPTGVVLWTRVNEGVWDPGVALGFRVARDLAFRDIALEGAVEGSDFGPDTDYTVHVDLDGRLDPGASYYYRFYYGRTRSRMGRCRTLPDPSSHPDGVTLALVTCQDFTNGYYGGFTHVALDLNVDFVLHLGDLIYETTGGTAFQDSPYPDRQIALPSGQNRAFSLADFRALYRRYREDRWFQMALEYHTWIVIWDDHETSNDCYWDYTRDTLGAPDHPFQTDPAYGNDPARLRRLKLDSQRAWAEYVPTRAAFDPAAGHPFDALRIYQSLQFGDLLELFLTDQRTYRSPHPCGEADFGGRLGAVDCPQRHDLSQTMLGDLQRTWLLAGVAQSTARWKAWGNAVFLGELTLGEPGPRQLILNNDAWDGYLAERDLILRSFRDAGVTNLVALTGDMHTFMASYLKIDHTRRANTEPDNVVGVEFMTPALTSSNLAGLAGVTDPETRDWGNPVLNRILPRYFLEALVRSTNPHVRFFNSQDWGYSTITFTHDWCEWAAFRVDKSVNQFPAPIQEIQRLRVPAFTNRILLGPLPEAPG
jgi:alkaline phosphatase D